jgi:hypothetical protein
VDTPKSAQCVCIGINFSLARAAGATREAHFISYCRQLPPREILSASESYRTGHQLKFNQWCLPVTVKVADWVPPAYVPEIKTLVFDDTLWVLTVKFALV